MISRPQGADIEITYEAAVTGLLATARFRIEDGQGSVVVASQAFDAEIGTTGVYTVTISGIGTVGQYVVLATPDGSYDPESLVSDSLVIYEVTDVPSFPPLTPIADDGVGSVGPCQAWTDVDSVAECCGLDEGTDPDVFETAVIAASQLLYPLSGSRFSGACERTVRPCSTTCPGWVVGRDCGCPPMSRVHLPGYVREILEVKIDGLVVSADTYRLDERRYLTRVPDPSDLGGRLYWPSCQDMSLADSEENTFAITYTYGVDPPVPGILAARELACQIYRATCSGGSGDAADCALPSGITRLEREGITIELSAFSAWGRDARGIWVTGLPLVDAFLNAFNPQGKRKRSTVWSPDHPRFPRPVGTAGGS